MKPGVLWDQWEGEKMWGHVRVWICELCLRFGRVWNFGIWAADQEFASWGVRERGFGEWRMAVQGARGGVRGLFLSSLSRSLSPLPVLLAPSRSLSLSLSLPFHVLSCSSCRSPHSLSLSGSYRQEFKGPLLYANSAGTTAAGRRDTLVRRRLRDRRFLCEFSCASLASYTYQRMAVC